MNKIYKVAIVGGGFSALVAANQLNKDILRDTVIFERLDRVGKKILSTGNGRGNFTNEEMGVEYYHGAAPDFAEYALKTYDNRSIRGFFEKSGVLSTVENGRVYPKSLQANAVLDALRLSLENANIITACKVMDIQKKNGVFLLKTEKGDYYVENVLLCAGGSAAKNFGTDGSAYQLVQKFGHKTGKLYPSLVHMRAEGEPIKGLKGVKHTANVSLFDGDRFIKNSIGDLLFTDNGVSGNTIFYLSAYLPELKSPVIKIDFAQGYTEEELLAALKARRGTFHEQKADILLSGIVHSALAMKIARKLFGDKPMKALCDGELSRAAKEVKNYRVTITGTTGFDYAQVTRGGILTKDIDDKTMMSKLCEGLFFCGEIVDIDGDCGGYNLQWAFSSASLAADCINKKYNK